jgi:hypothetical protein
MRIIMSFVALAMVTQASCATTSERAVQFERLVFDNASPEVVRVFIHLGNHEFLVGRVEPMRRVELRIRAGALPLNVLDARVLVRTLGTPSVSRTALTLQSDSYPLPDLIRHGWRYSGSRVVPLSYR